MIEIAMDVTIDITMSLTIVGFDFYSVNLSVTDSISRYKCQIKGGRNIYMAKCCNAMVGFKLYSYGF